MTGAEPETGACTGVADSKVGDGEGGPAEEPGVASDPWAAGDEARGGKGAGLAAGRAALCRDSTVADELMAGVSEGVGREAGFAGGGPVEAGGALVAPWGGGGVGAATAARVGAEAGAGDPSRSCINCLIRSTVGGSRLARALTLTSRPHLWIRSSSS